MQDRYSGDIGDFAKYGLLRGLLGAVGDAGLRLGVVWYRVPNESHNADGRHTAYLEPTPRNMTAYQGCDAELYRSLGRLVASGARSISRATEAGVLRSDTVYYDRPLTFEGVRQGGRCQAREDWLTAALAATKHGDVVFVDPDNGFEVKVPRTAAKGPKYAFFDELKRFLDRGQGLIVYQHASRAGTIQAQLNSRFEQIKRRLGVAAPWALWFRRVSPRFFFVIPAGEDQARNLARRTREFLDGPWATHFTECRPESQ